MVRVPDQEALELPVNTVQFIDLEILGSSIINIDLLVDQREVSCSFVTVCSALFVPKERPSYLRC